MNKFLCKIFICVIIPMFFLNKSYGRHPSVILKCFDNGLAHFEKDENLQTQLLAYSFMLSSITNIVSIPVPLNLISFSKIFLRYGYTPTYPILSDKKGYILFPAGDRSSNKPRAQLKPTKFIFNDLGSLCDNFIDKYGNYLPPELKISGAENNSYFQKIIVGKDSKVCFIGDIHGNADALLVILWDLVFKGYLNENLEIIKDNFYMVFTGDYTDYSLYGSVVWAILMKLKLANFDRVILLRGNHECEDQASSDGFWKELDNIYGSSSENIKTKFKTIWRLLPTVLFLGCNENELVWCCHGGIDPTYPIENILKILNHHGNCFSLPFNLDIYTGFSWSDFLPGSELSESSRGAGVVIGGNWAKGYLSNNFSGRVKVIFRGHQHHGSSVKLLNSGWSDYPDYWKNVVETEAEKNNCEFNVNKYGPVVTFTTFLTAGHMRPGDPLTYGYGLLSLTERYNDWTLKVVEFKGDVLKAVNVVRINDHYVVISQDGDKIKIEFQEVAPALMRSSRLPGTKAAPAGNNLIDALNLLKLKLLELAQKLQITRLQRPPSKSMIGPTQAPTRPQSKSMIGSTPAPTGRPGKRPPGKSGIELTPVPKRRPGKRKKRPKSSSMFTYKITYMNNYKIRYT